MRLGQYIEPPSHFQYDVVDMKAPALTTVRDARMLEAPARIQNEGFELRDCPTSCQDFWDDREILRSYYPEMRTLIRRALGADQVVIFDHTVRSSGGASSRRPVERVHCDYTESSGPLQLERLAQQGVHSRIKGRLLVPEELERLARGRFMLVNVWRSIASPGEPVETLPLAVCDARSVSAADRLFYEVIHPIYADQEGENYALRFNEEHRWYFYSKMMRDECLIFKSYDSQPNEAQFVFHTSVAKLPADPVGSLRQSVEVRALALFETGLGDEEVLQRKVKVRGNRIVGKESPHE
eukprot:TRINITY_DN77811_c0_g1_i1.p1 TRINITY_DN77811_c0_g1~~TRINITY_DN77811_c0_g1_i1.p1  ORF type:complete len:336 (-),score=39.22 TRINITY_DN77811_c0_g1_i1:99-986(-)